jgi:hypothetical protein
MFLSNKTVIRTYFSFEEKATILKKNFMIKKLVARLAKMAQILIILNNSND